MDNQRDRKLTAFEFLCDNRLGVLSYIAEQENTPHGALVYYVVDGKNIYFVTTQQSQKVKNLTHNNRASFTIFTEIPPLELQMEGNVEFISDPGMKAAISKIYLENANKNPETINWPPILKLPNDEGFDFLKFEISHFKYSNFTEKTGSVVEGVPGDWD